MPSGPSVAVIVVDHDGGDMTRSCLEHLVAAGGARLVLVDNGSRAPLTVDQLAGLPGVEVVRSVRNLGFGGGVNLGLEHLGVGRPGQPPRPGAPARVALINNDAFVAPGWLPPLVDALAADPALGAVSAKLVFEPEFSPVEVRSTVVPQRRGPALGMPVVAGPGAVFGEGFAAVLPGQWWTVAERAVLYVPVGGDGPGSTMVRPDPSVAEVPGSSLSFGQAGAPCSVVQNAGNELTDDLWVRDRGARQPDDGRFDAPTDVWGWCGGAVLLRADYLADVGWFDERLFLYWEDVDLSWRGADRGWRYRFVPTSVVRHRHGASMGDRSPRFEYLNQRNRLVVLAQHAGARPAARAWARQVAEIGWFAWRDVLRPVLRLGRPDVHRVAVRVRALAGAVGLLVRPRPRAARAGPPPGGPGR